jgi:hypothetical protein
MCFFKRTDVILRPYFRMLSDIAATVRLAVIIFLVLWPFFIAVIFRALSSGHGRFPLYF